MRPLLSFILSVFLFISPPEKAVAGTPNDTKQIACIQDQPTHFKHFTLVDDCLPAAQINKNRNAVSQLRTFTADNFFNTVSPESREIFLRETNYIIRPYFYCKPIGLKLVFPEHYFW